MQFTATVRRNIEALSTWLVEETGDHYWQCWTFKGKHQLPDDVFHPDLCSGLAFWPEHKRTFTLFVKLLFEQFVEHGKNHFNRPLAVCDELIPLVNAATTQQAEIMTVGCEGVLYKCCVLFNETFQNFSELITPSVVNNVMWFFCGDNSAIRSAPEGTRKIFVTECSLPVTKQVFKHLLQRQRESCRTEDGYQYFKQCYTVVEEWNTSHSQGNTFGWNYFSFDSYEDAFIFVLRLLNKLNNAEQNALLQAGEHLATDITKSYKKVKLSSYRLLEKFPQSKTLTKDRKKLATPSSGKYYKPCEPGYKHIYAFDMGNGVVKIGISQNIEERRKTVIGHSGSLVARYAYTVPFRESDASRIENELHNHFAPYNTVREFFKVPYNEVLKALETYSPLTRLHVR